MRRWPGALRPVSPGAPAARCSAVAAASRRRRRRSSASPFERRDPPRDREESDDRRLPPRGILRAEGLLRQARAATRLQVNGNVTTTTLNTGVEFQGSTVTPQNSGDRVARRADMPIVARRRAGRGGRRRRTRSTSPS